VPTRQFTHREFAFTLQNDAYLRYQSFHSHEELRKEVLRLNPSRFEIGPMYSGRVSRQSCPSRRRDDG
jgi:DNA primase small subunit